MLFRQITIKLPARESEILEKVCRETSRTKTDIIRSVIRTLDSHNKNEDI